jgi:hypothetical protein
MIQMSEEANGFEDRKEMKKKGEKRGIFSRISIFISLLISFQWASEYFHFVCSLQ